MTKQWTFFSNHAHVLICLAQNSEAKLRDISLDVGITERAVQRIISELEEAKVVKRFRVGRCNRYEVDLSQSLRHPLESHCSLSAVFNTILK